MVGWSWFLREDTIALNLLAVCNSYAQLDVLLSIKHTSNAFIKDNLSLKFLA